MQFDPSIAEKLLNLSDEKLWQTVRKIAMFQGIKLAEELPKENDMSKLRDAVTGITQSDMAGAEKLLAEWKKERR